MQLHTYQDQYWEHVQNKLKPEDKAESTRNNSVYYNTAERAKIRGVRLSIGYAHNVIEGCLNKSAYCSIRHRINVSLIDINNISKPTTKLASNFDGGVTTTLISGNHKFEFVVRSKQLNLDCR